MSPESTVEQEPRLFAALQRTDERPLPDGGDGNDVVVQLGFDGDGAYLQIVDANGRPRDVDHRGARGPARAVFVRSSPAHRS